MHKRKFTAEQTLSILAEQERGMATADECRCHGVSSAAFYKWKAKKEWLCVKRRRGRKRATGTREPMPVPDGPSKRWSLDFVSDVFGPVRRFRMLNMIDDYTREGPALVADTSLSGSRVAR